MSDNILSETQFTKENKESFDSVLVSNPFVHAYFMMYRQGLISREEALMECIVALDKQNSDLIAKIIEYIGHSPIQIIAECNK